MKKMKTLLYFTLDYLVQRIVGCIIIVNVMWLGKVVRYLYTIREIKYYSRIIVF